MRLRGKGEIAKKGDNLYIFKNLEMIWRREKEKYYR